MTPHPDPPPHPPSRTTPNEWDSLKKNRTLDAKSAEIDEKLAALEVKLAAGAAPAGARGGISRGARKPSVYAGFEVDDAEA